MNPTTTTDWAILEGLQDKALLLEDAIVAGRALQRFLVGNPDAADEFFTRVAAIRELRRKGSPKFPAIESTLTAAIQQRVLEFLKRISTLSPIPGAPGITAKG